MAGKSKTKQFLANFIQPEINNPEPTLQPLKINPFERIGPLPTGQYNDFNRPVNF